jgi:putative DNA primase/helicase
VADYSLDGLNITPEEFLGAFFAPPETVCIRIFSDKSGSAFSGLKLECEQGHFDQINDTLKKHNAQNRGIYFVVNHGGHEDSEIKRINAQFMECDDAPLEEQLGKIRAFPLEPSLIVKTRKSLHCYWLIKGGKVDRFRHIQRGLIAHFGADHACVNESRVFRLPGFNHCKEEPVLVQCVKYSPELRYTQKQLEAVLPDIPDEPAPKGKAAPIKDRGTQKGLKATGLRCLFFKHCKKNAKTLSEPDWYAMITNLAVFEGGEAAIHTLSKPYRYEKHRKT